LTATPLAWGRIVLGVLFVLRTTPIALPLHFDFTAGTYPLLGWPTAAWHGSLLPFAFPPWAIAVLCVARTFAAVLFAAGVWTRFAGLTAGAAGYFVMLQRPFAFDATLHMLFQGTMLLALTDAGAALAVRPVAARNPASGILLVRIFVASIYFWAGIAKLRPDWLDGRTLELFQRDGALAGPFSNFVLSTPTSRMVMACAVAGTELSLPALLFWQKTRRFAPFIALSLHAAIEWAAHPDLIGWVIGALLLCLLPWRPSAD
jgi:vitamin K-dependent gamma-carboxylase